MSSSRINFVFMSLLFFTVLVVSYLTFISELFSYAGMTSDFNAEKFGFACFAIVISACMVNLNRSSVSGIGQLIILCMMLMPIFAFWACSNRESNIQFISLFSYLLISIFTIQTSAHKIKLKSIQYAKYIIYAMSFLIVAVLFVSLLRSGMLAHFSLGISDVYERRAVLSSGALGPMSGYLLAWTTKIVVPALVVYNYVKRNYLLSVFFCVIQISLFGLTGHKEQIVNLFVVIGIAYLLEKKTSIVLKGLKWLLLLSIVICGIGISFDNEFRILSAALFSRAFYSIALNHFDYYAFFQQNEFVYWSNSFLSGLYDFPFTKTVPQLVGYGRWSEGVENVANAGFIGSGYMHFGVLGVAIYSIFIGVIFRICDTLVTRQHLEYQVPICSLGFLQLVNGDLTTTLLTNGLALMLIILVVLRK